MENKEGPNNSTTETPKVEVFDPVKDIADKFDFYIKIVIGILVVAVATMIIMVGTLIVDSFHVNSAIYKEYSEKIETLNDLQKTNQEQLELIKSYQETIKGLLKQ